MIEFEINDLKKVLYSLRENSHDDIDRLTENSDFTEALNLSSLDIVHLLVSIENQHSIRLDFHYLKPTDFSSIKDFISFMKRHET